MNNLPVIIIGGGGHAKVLLDTLQMCHRDVLGITDVNPELQAVLGIPVMGDDEAVLSHPPGQVQLVNGIGSVSQPVLRKEIYEKFKASGYTFSQVIHPSAIISKESTLAEGAQVLAGSVVQTGCWIGENSIINSRASIDHDCRIGNHVHIAPGVTLSGNVEVGELTHIGTGAAVIQGIQIGRKSIIGAGVTITKNVPDNSKISETHT